MPLFRPLDGCILDLIPSSPVPLVCPFSFFLLLHRSPTCVRTPPTALRFTCSESSPSVPPYTRHHFFSLKAFVFCALQRKSSVTLSQSKVFMVCWASSTQLRLQAQSIFFLNISELTVSGSRTICFLNNLFASFL